MLSQFFLFFFEFFFSLLFRIFLFSLSLQILHDFRRLTFTILFNHLSFFHGFIFFMRIYYFLGIMIVMKDKNLKFQLENIYLTLLKSNLPFLGSPFFSDFILRSDTYPNVILALMFALTLNLITLKLGTMGGCCCGPKDDGSGLSTLQKLKWKFRIASSSFVDNKIKLLEDPQYAGLLKLLNHIPDNCFVKFVEKVNVAIFYSDPCCNFNYKKNFINWGETYKAIYQDILYPTDVAANTGKQIEGIQKFVSDGVKNGKRIRGAGIRHSWGSIFSDPEQLLISFYPYKVAKGTSRQLEDYAIRMMEAEEALVHDNIENLCMIRKVGETDVLENGKTVKKHLIKIGAGVSNDQLRRWCIKNGYQYKSNVIMVEVNVCGGLGTCSHGAGLGTQTLADYIYEIEFIDYNGSRQIISKKTHPRLIKSAASALGLLGPVVFITMEMDDLEIIRTTPRNSYKDFVIPWPKDYPKEKQEARRRRREWKVWNQLEHKKKIDESWEANFERFRSALNQTYCEWFYFPIEELHLFQNVWSSFGKKNPENLANIKKDNPDGVFMEDYPPPAIKFFSEFALFAGDELLNHELTHAAVNILMRAPFTFFPHRNIYMNYPDAVHFQRGIQNMKVRDFECEINIPSIEINGKKEPDYDLIQRIWWAALEIVQDNRQNVNMALQMRIFSGSQATLAPEMGYEYVCSIEILRTLALTSSTEADWRVIVIRTFNAWRGLRDNKGNKVIIRPHWGKEWDFYPEVKAHVMQDQGLRENVRQFMSDYHEIAKLRNFDAQKNLTAFSNAIYRELINGAMERPEDRIK